MIILTAHGSVNTAVEALKMGAFDFLAKGCDNDEVLKIVGKALATRTLNLVQPRMAGISSEQSTIGRFGLIGRSPAMRRVASPRPGHPPASAPPTMSVCARCRHPRHDRRPPVPVRGYRAARSQ